MRTLKQALEAAEARKGVGKDTAARMCGASRSTYRAWKHGQKPSLDKVAFIVRFTDEDPATILALCGISHDDVAAILDLTVDEARAHISTRHKRLEPSAA